MTIVPRGIALGITHSLPDLDAVSQDYQQYLAHIDVGMGGRAAEELIYGPEHVTSGIVNDLSQVTRTAYALVARFGFSEKLGNLDFHSIYSRLSSQTKQEIEQEMRDIIEGSRRRAAAIVESRRDELERLKDALLEYETLSREEIMQVMQGNKIQRDLETGKQKNGEEEKKEDEGKGGPSPPQPKPKKEIGQKGGVGIKLPGVLLPSETTRREGEEGQ